MLNNYVMATGDTVTVTIPGIVIPAAQKQPLIGTSTSLTIGGKPVCLKGDELPPVLKAVVTYTESGYSISGTGTLALTPAPGVNYTTVLKDNGKAVLIKGTPFVADFSITTPAANPNGQTASSSPKKGMAEFETENTFFTAV